MIIKYFNRISRSTSMFRSEHLSELDLQHRHFTYLILICGRPGISQEKITKKMRINKSSVARQLQILEDKGYIERKTSEKDKRVIEVYPTQKSLDIYPMLKETNQTWNDYLLEGFSEEETEQFVSYLKRVLKNASAHLDYKEDTE